MKKTLTHMTALSAMGAAALSPPDNLGLNTCAAPQGPLTSPPDVLGMSSGLHVNEAKTSVPADNLGLNTTAQHVGPLTSPPDALGMGNGRDIEDASSLDQIEETVQMADTDETTKVPPV